ncbi:nitrilase-related carbon-nitrogen hydrolase [Candidatus Contubernalis alkaliaceticus]|uniref:nitrilase-related carbon-nitrogen hydrolase n=1 Tax=Candidatus Contubernalis alkaliaceticus TaxID=338645 RepID=UPI001F4C434E|nr:nitrilase-related carbon-nitrogen hydrolase [Candidatus Contubernalis alkalaceticus]UNC93307.1 nitrilase [Candidatus Contubernalis alkalaceticus]
MKLNTTKEWLFLKYLKWRTRPAPINKYLQSKNISRTDNINLPDPEKIKVGACQLELKLLSDPLDYVEIMYQKVEAAAKEGVQLLVFPENNSFHLLGLLPGIEEMGETGEVGNAAAIEGNPSVKVADIFRSVGPMFNRTAEITFSYLARAFGMYIMAGSYLTPKGGEVFNKAYLFGPDGSQLGTQDKAHLMPIENDWGLSKGSGFHIFPTPLGRLAMPVCMDATYFETFRILEYMGAEVVMVPIANPEPYNYWLALRGIWPRVQESLTYGIKSALVGNLLGYTLTGKAGIFAPLELTPEGDGVLAEAKTSNEETLITAEINLLALGELKKNHPYLGDRNDNLQQKYFPGIYQNTP